MSPNKTLWEKGDFTRIADTMLESGAALVAKLGITKGLNIFDLGCGEALRLSRKQNQELMFQALI